MELITFSVTCVMCGFSMKNHFIRYYLWLELRIISRFFLHLDTNQRFLVLTFWMLHLQIDYLTVLEYMKIGEKTKTPNEIT